MDKNELIELSISLPLALKVLLLDKKQFGLGYAGNAYLSVLDYIQDNMERDIIKIRQTLYDDHRLILQKIGETTYKLIKNNHIEYIRFSKEELKEMTTNTLRKYMYNIDGKQIVPIDKQWKKLDMLPPDISFLD